MYFYYLSPIESGQTQQGPPGFHRVAPLARDGPSREAKFRREEDTLCPVMFGVQAS